MPKKTTQKKKTSTKKSEELTFEQQFAQLENIVEQIESEESSIDSSIEQFEEGLKLAQSLKNMLGETEQQIEELKQKYTEEA